MAEKTAREKPDFNLGLFWLVLLLACAVFWAAVWRFVL